MSSHPQAQVTSDRLLQIAWCFVQPLAIDSAAQNRVFDVLDAGPKTLDEVSKETGASARGLAAVMNLLVGIDLLAKSADGRYSLTPESATFLVSAKPGYMGAFLHLVPSTLAANFLKLPEIMRTGEPFEGGAERPEVAAEFFEQLVLDIMPVAFPAAQALADALGVARATQPVPVLDLAAGSGVWGIALAQTSAQVRVTAVDWPAIMPVTLRVAKRFGVADQLEGRAGDLFEVDFGAGYSIVTMGHILHMLGPKENQTLLKKAFAALAPGGTIAIGELLVNDERTGPVMSLAFAINMLLYTTNGNVYSFGEIRSWLEEAGFVNARLQPAPGPSPLVLADKSGKEARR